MPVVEANHVKLHAQKLGADGSPVVMLHGLLIGTQATWFFSVAPRLSHTHRVVTYDLRGHGMSERTPTGYGLRAMAEDLLGLIDSMFEEPVTLVGHSFGGAIALRFAVDYPERVSRLVLVETPLPVMSADSLQYFYDQSLDSLIEMLPEMQRETISRSGKRPGRLSRQIMELVGETSMNDDIMAEPDIADEELATVAAPTLLIYGRESPFSFESHDRLMGVLPDVRLTLLDGGHYLPYHAATELTEAIREFLDG